MARSGTGWAKIFGEENFSENRECAHRIELSSLFQMLLSIVENEVTVDVFRVQAVPPTCIHASCA